jgi:glycosyltransferase involved in cell wall biosynthesis
MNQAEGGSVRESREEKIWVSPEGVDARRVAALIPAYLEERRIGEVVLRARALVGRVLVVDDGSTDCTAREALAAGAEVLRHAENRGKGEAIRTGFVRLAEWAPCHYVVLLDGDGQHLPEEIGSFLNVAARENVPMLVGNRMSDVATMPMVRRWTNRFMSAQVSAVCGQRVRDSQCGFRMVHKDLLPLFARCRGRGYDFESEMLVEVARQGYRIAAVPISTVYGDEKSKIRPVRDALRFFALMCRLRKGSTGGM